MGWQREATATCSAPPRLPTARRAPELAPAARVRGDAGHGGLFQRRRPLGFLYKLVWRWQLGERDVVSAADPDGARLHAMIKAVHREEHDMHAYVRFRERPEHAGAPRFVAWFEPTHDVLPQVARHFANRMGRTTWMIATPTATVLDGEHLHHAPPRMRSAADIEDSGEALWLTYYRSIFNPARLNAAAAQPYPIALLEKPARRRHRAAMISGAANGERRTGQTSTVGRRSGATTIAVTPNARSRSAMNRTRWTNAVAATVAQRHPGRAGRRTEARAHHAGRRTAGRPGRPARPAFVGPAGAVLDRALAEAGVARTST
jgi:DNA polymerase